MLKFSYSNKGSLMLRLMLFLLILGLASCASVPYSEREELLAKTQCPIGYHLVQDGGLEVYSANHQEKRNEIEFKCVIDSAHDTLSNTIISQ
jgi:hypothetical protein